MENTISVTQNETFFTIYKFALRGILSFKIIRIIICVIAAFSLLTWLLNTLVTQTFDFYSLIYSLLNILVIVLVFSLLALLSTIMMRFTKPHFFKPLTYHFNHWGIHLEGENYSDSFQWKKITKIESKPKTYLLYENNIPSITIAKNNFRSQQELLAFEEMIKDKL